MPVGARQSRPGRSGAQEESVLLDTSTNPDLPAQLQNGPESGQYVQQQTPTAQINYRRWPSAIPSFNALCRSAPTVLFIDLEIFTTGVFARECPFNSRSSPLIHGRRLTAFAFFAIQFPPDDIKVSVRSTVTSSDHSTVTSIARSTVIVSVKLFGILISVDCEFKVECLDVFPDS